MLPGGSPHHISPRRPRPPVAEPGQWSGLWRERCSIAPEVPRGALVRRSRCYHPSAEQRGVAIHLAGSSPSDPLVHRSRAELPGSARERRFGGVLGRQSARLNRNIRRRRARGPNLLHRISLSDVYVRVGDPMVGPGCPGDGPGGVVAHGGRLVEGAAVAGAVLQVGHAAAEPLRGPAVHRARAPQQGLGGHLPRRHRDAAGGRRHAARRDLLERAQRAPFAHGTRATDLATCAPYGEGGVHGLGDVGGVRRALVEHKAGVAKRQVHERFQCHVGEHRWLAPAQILPLLHTDHAVARQVHLPERLV
mmetsp:Transcript_19740/g.43152  ORF Transcript_19740/g.43152 Transcript_19740/m.43152 type:complete len:306 (+) Transcript_19740:360-1277(+)